MFFFYLVESFVDPEDLVHVASWCQHSTLGQNIFDQMWTGLSYAEVTALRKRKLEWSRPER